MALDLDTLKKRLREAFGDDSQDAVGKKLGMTQGNVSKILSGSQQPALETVYHVAEIYDVSVDWLLGISDRKKAIKNVPVTTYGLAVEVLLDMLHNGVIEIEDKTDDLVIKSKDPLMTALTKNGFTLFKTDHEVFQKWKETMLSKFDEKPLLWNMCWEDGSVWVMAEQASTLSNWLKVYDRAIEANKSLSDLFDDPGPF